MKRQAMRLFAVTEPKLFAVTEPKRVFAVMKRVFLLGFMSFFLPETPRWLAKNGFMQESLQTVADLHSNGDTEAEHVQKVFLEIQEAVVYEAELGKAGWLVSN